ncbi:hypothetical protein K3495_g3882 [Podosphaera aphanis]|nr:hypothetical protein K3495_g3882 [Podosphaera aphanis]
MDNKNPRQKDTDSEEDSISLTSTVMSVHSENEFFEVEKILAENSDSKSETFLIKWEGYPVSRATWEPRNQIRHLRPVMNEWRHRQSLEESGELEPFNTAAWVAARQKSEDEKQDRKKRRLSKRKRLQRNRNFDLDQDFMFLPNINQPLDTYGQLGSQENEDFIRDDAGVKAKIEPDETLISESNLYLDSKSFQEPMTLDESDNVDNNSSLSLPNTTIHFKTSENASSFVGQTKTSHLVSAEEQSLTSREFVTSHRRRKSSSSSDEPLAHLIRRSKALQASTKAIEETSIITKSKPRVIITRLASDSSSSESDSLENQSLSSLLKSRLMKNSAISSGKKPAKTSKKTPPLPRNSPVQAASYSNTRKSFPPNYEETFISEKDSVSSFGQPTTRRSVRSRFDSPKQPTTFNHDAGDYISNHQPIDSSNIILTLGKMSESINLSSPGSQENISAKIQPLKNSNVDGPEKQSKGADELVHSNLEAHVFFDSVPDTHIQDIDKGVTVSDREQRTADSGSSASFSRKTKNATKEHISSVATANFSIQGSEKVTTCFFWNESICKFGKNCRFLHGYAEDDHVSSSSPSLSCKNIGNSLDFISSKKTSNSKKQKKKSANSSSARSSGSQLLTRPVTDGNFDTSLTKSSENPFYLNSPEESSHNQNSRSDTQNDDYMDSKVEDRSDLKYLSQRNPDNPTNKTYHSTQSLSSHFPMIREKPQAKVHSHHSIPKLDLMSSQEKIHGGKKRPSWNPKDPNNAVCYFWHKDGVCQKPTCSFYHFLEPDIPIAPSPKQQRKIKKMSELCKFWLRNDCIHTASSCRFSHCLESEELKDNTQRDTGRDQMMVDILTTKTLQPEKEQFSNDESIEKKIDTSSTTAITSPHNSHTELHNSIEIETEALASVEEREITSSPVMNAMIKINKITQPSLHEDNFEVQSQLTSTLNLELEPQAAQDQDDPDYQIPYNFEDSGGMIKQVTLGTDNSSPIALDFGNFDTPAENSWKRLFISTYGLHFKHLCLAQDLQNQMGLCKIPVLWQECVRTVDPDDLDTTKIIEAIVDELLIRCGGLIAKIGDFSILMYPAKREEWRFLDQLSNLTPDVRLRYSLLSHNFNLELHGVTAIGAGSIPYTQFLVHKIQKFLIPDLLQDFILKDDKNPPPGKFYLIFPPSASQMANFMKFCLFSYNINFKVYGSMTPGSWDVFSQTTSYKSIHDLSEKLVPSIVLIHESIANEICRLPKLSNILDKPEVVFWQISEGISRSPPYPSRHVASNLKLGNITASKLFPHGCAVLLTPSFLVAEPTAALDFIKWFTVERFPNQATPWRIVGAYDLPQYILDVAKSKAFEALSYENRHSRSPSEKINQVLEGRFLGYSTCKDRWDLYTELRKLNTRSPDDSDFEDELEDCLIHAPGSIHPENEHDLIRWFAGWSTINSDMFRKFIVIGTGTTNAPRAKYLKKIMPKSTNANSDISKVTTPHKSAAAATLINEMTRMQKTSPIAPSNPPSRAQTLDSLIEEAIMANPTDIVSSEMANSSTREPPDLFGSNQNHQVDEVINNRASHHPTPPPQLQTKAMMLSGGDEPDLDRENSRPNEIFTSPNNNVDGSHAARQAPLKKWKEMKFEATTEWYKRLQARGDAWEHITVIEHVEAWKLIGFGAPA